MKNFILGFLLASLMFGAGYWMVCRRLNQDQAAIMEKTAPRYHCPMHPTYTSDKQGDCPICGMKLVPIEESDEHSRQVDSRVSESNSSTAKDKPERRILYYVDSMNPNNRSDKPGKAPDGMDLVPVYEEESPPAGAGKVSDRATVKIPEERRQMMGILTEEAKVMDLEQDIRTVGRVTMDETRLHHIHSKYEGFIEEIYINFVGQYVKKGDPLFSIYSPELLASQREYILALKARDQWKETNTGWQLPGVDLVESARRRLALWDIDELQIAQIERTREPIHFLVFRSPVSGFVSAKIAVQGMKIMPSDTLYDIMDLASVWVLADIYEINVPFVKIGQSAIIQLPYQSGGSYRGKVVYINPTVDEKTRTVKARLEFANPDQQLKPEMFVDVLLQGRLGRGVVVPESAVLSTGERMIVFVSQEDGVYEPREVTTGSKVRGFYEIKKGVVAGEKVVTEANFLLDSESKLKASLSGMGGGHPHGN